MTYLGLDLGSKTCGVAISDRTGIIASSLEVIRYYDYEDLLHQLELIVIERKVDAVVLGNPLNLDGSLSKRSEITLEFRDMLIEKFHKEVFMQDERLSTVAAERSLIEGNVRRENRKKVIDMLAAVIILQGYLDSKRIF